MKLVGLLVVTICLICIGVTIRTIMCYDDTSKDGVAGNYSFVLIMALVAFWILWYFN